jgi:hypothetical protein
MDTRSAKDRITEAVTQWPGVEAGVGMRGELGFRYRRVELGHLHGDRVAHFSFPRELGAELRASGRVGPHPVAPDSTKLVARHIASHDDERDVIELMRLNYERVVARDRQSGGGGEGASRASSASWTESGPTSHGRGRPADAGSSEPHVKEGGGTG